MNLRSVSFAQRLNRNMRHWFGTGSGSDRAPAERALGGDRALPLPALRRYVIRARPGV
jgi:hypothetical protein